MISKVMFVLFLFLILNDDCFSDVFFNDDTTKNNSNKPVSIYNTIRLSTEKPVIDGKLNDECWKTGE